jgi:hypothetical protein
VVIFHKQSECAIAAAEEAAFAKAAEFEEGRAFAKVHTPPPHLPTGISGSHVLLCTEV